MSGSLISSPQRAEPTWSPHKCFHDLPVEMVRKICEMAAVSRVTACALCLVSKQVSHWIAPILYHTLAFHDHDIDVFNEYYSSYPKRNLASGMRILLIWSDEGRLPILNDCYGLTTLNVDYIHKEMEGNVEFHQHTNHPGVTHLTLRGYSALSVLSFRSVTHLHVKRFYTRGNYNNLRPENLPSLTHVLCTLTSDYFYNSMPLQKQFPGLFGILASFPYLHKVAVHFPCQRSLDKAMRERQANHLRGQLYGHPNVIVLVSHDFSHDAWMEDSDGMWERVKRHLA